MASICKLPGPIGTPPLTACPHILSYFCTIHAYLSDRSTLGPTQRWQYSPPSSQRWSPRSRRSHIHRTSNAYRSPTVTRAMRTLISSEWCASWPAALPIDLPISAFACRILPSSLPSSLSSSPAAFFISISFHITRCISKRPQFLTEPRAWKRHPLVTRVTLSPPSSSSSNTARGSPATSFDLDFSLPPLSAPFSTIASVASFLVGGDISSQFQARIRVRSMPRAQRGGLTVELIQADWRLRLRSDATLASSPLSRLLSAFSSLRAWLPAGLTSSSARTGLNGTVVWTAWPFSPQGDAGIHVNQELTVRAPSPHTMRHPLPLYSSLIHCSIYFRYLICVIFSPFSFSLVFSTCVPAACLWNAAQTSGSWLGMHALGDQIDAAARVFLERVCEALAVEAAAALVNAKTNSNTNSKVGASAKAATKESRESAAGATVAKAPHSGGAAAMQ